MTPNSGSQVTFQKIWSITVIFVLLASTTAEEKPASKNPKWAQNILDVLKARDSIIEKFTALGEEATPKKLEDLVSNLIEYTNHFKGIDNLDALALEQDKSLIKDLFDQPEKPIVYKHFQSDNLESHYGKRGLGFILKTFRGYHSLRCMQELYSPPQPYRGFDLPLQSMCTTIREDLGKEEKYTYSTDKICKNVNECAGKETLHPYCDSKGTSAADACTEEDNKCDVAKALPMMGALLWYKTSDFIAQSLCSNTLGQPDKSSLDQKFKELESMAHIIIAYISTLHWRDFFDQAIRRRAFSDLGEAMSLVEQRIKSMEFATLACKRVEATDLCTVGDIYKEYQSLKGLKKTRNTERRDLHLQAYVDHGKMLDLKKNALHHIELLGEIRSLNEDLQASVKGISKYFIGLAYYDQRIADADVAFIDGKLKEFGEHASKVSEKLEKDIQAAMASMLTGNIAQLIEESVILKLKIAENMNPLKVIFGGVEAGDIYEQVGKVAVATAELAHAIALQASLKGVLLDTSELTKKFKENADQIANLQTLIDSIKNNDVEKLEEDADEFIKAYGDYTPKVDRSLLAKNDALWGAFKDTTCDLLMNVEGVAANVVRGVAGGMLMCERLEGTLAEYATLREDIFDFQFDLVDTFARVVRGNIAKKLAKEIKPANDLLDAGKLMLGFFMTQYRLQSQAFLYCDKLEYRNQGKKVAACNIQTEYFTMNHLDRLIAYKPPGQYHEDERFVYIPTKPQFPGDKGVINLPSLAKGNEVVFEIPRNTTWLRKFNWLSRGETLAPFVASFKLYLPLKSYDAVKNRRRHLKTKLHLQPKSGSFVSESSNVVYNLPSQTSEYNTVYEEGYQRCPNGKKITNPYSLCGNLPRVCDTSERETGTSLMPTILTTWKLSYTVESGATDLEWDAPDPATDLLIIGKVKLRFPGRSRRRSDGKRSSLFKRNGEPALGCCSGNTYRPKWNNPACIPCPSKPTASQSQLGGYYCKKGSEDVAGEPPPIPSTPSARRKVPKRNRGEKETNFTIKP